MPFNLVNGNDLEKMAARLCTRLAETHPDDPLVKRIIVVHASGMATWLAQRIASYNGISANIDFTFPGNFLYKHLFAPLAESEPDITIPEISGEGLPFAPEYTSWRIMALLEHFHGNPAFHEVDAYIDGNDLKRRQIAERIARIFDRYMTYRPHILAQWELKADPNDWQSILWRTLVQGDITHFSGLYKRFMDRAKSGRIADVTAPLQQYGTIFFFGFSALPPTHLALIRAAAETADIDFFWFNPTTEYPSEPVVAALLRDDPEELMSMNGHPLLQSLGRRGREFFKFVMDITDGQIYDELFLPQTLADGALLQRLQHDIQSDKLEPAVLPLPDPSFEIHNCFSPQREVEALYDYLLAAFAENPALLPKDVIVHTADIETYAPYIEAVFGTTDSVRPRIPYTIADRALGQEYPEFRFYLTLLSLRHSRFTVTDILDLLALPAIRKRFEIAEDDVAVLVKLLKSANLAWGIDEDFRETQCGVRFRENSWRFALERLMLGVMCKTDTPLPLITLNDTDLAPLENAANTAALVGKFNHFCETIFRLCEFGPMAAGKAWIIHLRELLSVFKSDTESEAGCVSISRAIAELERQLSQTGFLERTLHEDVITAWVKGHADGVRGGERFCRGVVTFCRFQAMRSIPAKVVCMLGLNDNIFPKNDQYLSFDLMLKARHIADSSVRDDDRFAFLEALLSAREKLVIFYTGQSDRTDETLPPSVLVSELCDTLELAYGKGTTEKVTAVHPLHPFGHRYFTPQEEGAPPLRNFDPDWARIARHALQDDDHETKMPIITAPEIPVSLSLHALTAFLKEPCKKFYERQIGLSTAPILDELPSEYEPDALDGLQRYHVAQTLLSTKHEDDPETARALLATGGFPRGVRGKRILENIQTQIHPLRQRLQSSNENPALPDHRFALEIGGIRLHGALDHLFREHQIIPLTSSLKAKYELHALLRHMVLSAVRRDTPELPAITTVASFSTKKEYNEINLAPVGYEEAYAYLSAVIELYKSGLAAPLCFDPEISTGALAGYKEMCRKWAKNDFGYQERDPWFLRIFGENPPPDESELHLQAEEIAVTILAPWDALTGGES